MPKFALTLAVCVLVCFAAAVVAQSPDPKAAALQLQPGAYVWTGLAWNPMQQITLAGGGSKHMAKMFVPGLTPSLSALNSGAVTRASAPNAANKLCGSLALWRTGNE